MPPAVTYTILRLLTFFVPLAIMLLLGFNEWFSAIIAALIGFAVSLLFLRRSRDRVSMSIYERRQGRNPGDEHVESDEDVEDVIADDAAQHADDPDHAGSADGTGNADETGSADGTGNADETENADGTGSTHSDVDTDGSHDSGETDGAEHDDAEPNNR